MTPAPLSYESCWGWLVTADPAQRASVSAALGPEGPPPVDLADALEALAEADGQTLQAIDAFLAGARYPASRQPAFTRLPFDYRRVPPKVRGALLGLLARLASSAAAPFPEWPAEDRLDQARSRVWTAAALVAGVTLRQPAWPGGASAAVLLTHDIDVVEDLGRIESLRVLEREQQLPAAFGFVPLVTWPEQALVERLITDGCECYVHDGRFAYSGRPRIEASLEALFDRNPWAQPLFRGFRSGQLLTSTDLLAALAARFDYDLTFPDVERGGPYGGVAGAGTVIPFMLGPLLEIPLTIPQDFFVEQVLRLDARGVEAVWRSKLESVIVRGGVAVVNTHPLWVNPERPAMWQAYRGLLTAIGSDPRLWVTTPSFLAAHMHALRG